MADSITGYILVLSAVFKAKADTKDRRDGFSWNKGGKFPLLLLRRSLNTFLLLELDGQKET